jgi:hypothetical protein
MMSVKGILGPQENMMISPQLSPQGMADGMGSHGPGNPENLMFVHEGPCQNTLGELQEVRLLVMQYENTDLRAALAIGERIWRMFGFV